MSIFVILVMDHCPNRNPKLRSVPEVVLERSNHMRPAEMNPSKVEVTQNRPKNRCKD